MEKRMEELTVRTSEGSVQIVQYENEEGEGLISIPPEQVDGLIKWLQEAKAELEEKT